MTPERPHSRRRPGWWYPWIFVGGFAVVMAVNFTMAYFAVHTFSGLSTEQAYEKGLAYNNVLAMAEKQKALGWTVGAEIEPRPAARSTHRTEVRVSFRDKDGQPVTGLSVDAEFIRPTIAGHDRSIRLEDKGDGRYASLASLDLPGQWEMRVTAQAGTVAYQFDRRIMVP